MSCPFPPLITAACLWDVQVDGKAKKKKKSVTLPFEEDFEEDMEEDLDESPFDSRKVGHLHTHTHACVHTKRDRGFLTRSAAAHGVLRRNGCMQVHYPPVKKKSHKVSCYDTSLPSITIGGRKDTARQFWAPCVRRYGSPLC